MKHELDNNQLAQSMHMANLERLNDDLRHAREQCDEQREENARLISMQEQLEERVQQLNDLNVSMNHKQQLTHLEQLNESLQCEKRNLQQRLDDMQLSLNTLSTQSAIQRVDSPREVSHSIV
jgi:predicted nuclease with TOPRIM domain